MSFKDRISEARRDKAGRTSEQAKKRKKALAKKKDRLTSLGLVNKNPLSEDENPLSLGNDNPSSTVDEHAHNFVDTLLDLLELEDSQNVIEAFSIGGVTHIIVSFPWGGGLWKEIALCAHPGRDLLV